MKKATLLALAVTGLLSLPFFPSMELSASPVKDSFVSVSRDKLNGWITEGDLTYYYKDGEQLTGPQTIEGKQYFFDQETGAQQRGLVLYNGKKYFYSPENGTQIKGFVTWENNTYYFGSKGYARKGIRKVNGRRYYFNSEGVLIKNALIKGRYYAGPDGYFISGWGTFGENTYYFDAKTLRAVTGWKYIDKKMHFFNADGTLQKLSGLHTAANNRNYYYDPVTGEMTKGWVTVGETTYYFSLTNGRAVKGWRTIDGKKYYFDVNGILQKNQFIKDLYYVNENGERVYGWYTINEKKYYFGGTKGKVLQEGWRTIDNRQYYVLSDHSVAFSTWISAEQYVDENGTLVSGWREIDEKTYFFSKKTKKRVTGWKRIEGQVYFFDTNGVLQTLTGLQANNSNIYYFDPVTNLSTSGWITIDEKTYYFAPSTKRAVKGWRTIDGIKYYFNEDKTLARNQFVKDLYYVDENGKRVYGWYTINEKTYYFNGTKGKVLSEGWQTIDEKRYYVQSDHSIAYSSWVNTSQYVDENGQPVVGWREIDDNMYYFSPENGTAYTDWKEIDLKTYYFDKTTYAMAKETWVNDSYLDADGVMVKDAWVGAYYIGYNGKKTGETREPGLFTEDNKTYLLDENFELLTGWQTVDEKTYYFNETTGVMEKLKWVDGYYLDANGLRTSAAWTTIEGVNYLFLENGKKATGMVDYNDKKYYFSTTTGAQQTGFKVIDNTTYYFNPSKGGAMAMNETVTINGIPYNFDENGHMRAALDVTVDEALGREIVAYAQSFIGYPYVWGGDKDLTKGVDCSGFTMLVMKHFGIKIPRTTWLQHDGVKGYKTPIRVAVEDLKPGDLIFYYSGNTHVGIYIGDGKIVHASNSSPYPQGGIKISDYDYTYIYGCVRYWYDESLPTN